MYKINILKIITLNKFFYIFSLMFLVILALASFIPCEQPLIFARCENEANRWFYFNPTPLPQIPLIGEIGFQPSEFAKFTLILFLGVQLSISHKKKYRHFWNYLFASGAYAGLILLQPNMSTAVTVFAIGTFMYLASGASIKPLIIMTPLILLLGFIFIVSTPYRRERLATYLKPNETSLDSDEAYQIKQAKIALGSGGLFGKGFGESRQKYGYTPEIASDATFAIVGEEFGFIGVTILLFVYGGLIYKGMLIAKRSDDPVFSLIAVGITTWIGLQVLVHVCSNAGIIPYTGMTLPLISYGGSSLVFTLMGLGLLANINKSI
jgi:cell division protein FtsW